MTEEKKVHPPVYYIVVTNKNRWGKAGTMLEAIENATDYHYPEKGDSYNPNVDPDELEDGEEPCFDEFDYEHYESCERTRCIIYIVPEILYKDFEISNIDGGVSLYNSELLMEAMPDQEKRMALQMALRIYATWNNGKPRIYPDMEMLEAALV